VSYPARIQLVAAMNPCRCGMAGTPGHACSRGPRCQTDYQARISGPLMDRIDVRVEVPAVMPGDLIRRKPGETSAAVAARVAGARALQADRYTGLGMAEVGVNAHCPTAMIEEVAKADGGALQLLADAADKMRFSARGYHRILKLARTLADLDGHDAVGRIHIAEAISYRIMGDAMAAAA
jgi:magnesium chelatase family protein